MSPSFPSTSGVKVSNIQLVNPPLFLRAGTVFQLEISHNGGPAKQSQKKKLELNENSISWFESLSFAGGITNESFLTFRVVRIRLGFARKALASFEENIFDLFRLQKDSGLCKLIVFDDCHLVFTIERLGDILSELVIEAQGVNAHTSASEILDNNVVVAQEDTWTVFLSNFEIFMKAMDQVVQVNSYAKLAWSILSVIPKTIIAQNKRNENVIKLSRHLKDVYEYITDAKRLPTLKGTQSKALSILVQQTVECAYFIQEYSTSDTINKVWRGVSDDDKINQIIEIFDHTLKVMTNSITLEINIVTLRISNDISKLSDDTAKSMDLALLNEMPYALNAGFFSGKSCHPGTRERLTTEILDWVNRGSERILLLLGQTGTGKSAVAHTISHIFDKQNRLGSLFCFSRSYKDRRNLLFSTISRQLADGDVQWRESLVRIIEKTTIRTSTDILTQFDELIVKPSKEVKTLGPVVVIIDGLDESGDRGQRTEILDLLFGRCSELPPNYRLLITSRPEPDIERWYNHPTVYGKRMDDIHLDENTNDIQRYISSFLSPVENILDNELNVDWRFLLAERAEGLFQWASTVCSVIDPTVEFGVAERVKTFISGSTSSLYQLYHQILDAQPEFRSTDFLIAFQTIIGAIVIMREPLSVQALQYLLGDDVRNVKLILQPFHSLFIGIHDLHTPVRPLHTSLTDFFTAPFIDITEDDKTSKMIANRFYVDTSDQGYFTLAALKLMNNGGNGLRFNICDLETSHKLNRDVPDLNHRIQSAIPLHLSYAGRFWAIHLRHSTVSEKLLGQLRILMHTNLLYLFEALSLLRKIEQVCISMKILAVWCEEVDKELADQAEDVCQFGYEFGNVMMDSTPHLYLSALPLAPNNSFIRKQFLDLFPRHLNIETGQSLGSSHDGTIVIKRHTSSWKSVVAFPPRGEYIATGFSNGELWLWDYRTGEMIHQWGPERAAIDSIVFSSDGNSVVACFLDGSVKIWDFQKNELVCHSHQGVFEDRCWYSTASHDGRYIVFHSHSNDVLLYDSATRSKPTRLAINSSVKSMFSPNGELVVFADRDNRASLWNTQKQELIGPLRPSETYERRITVMAFSPDGKRIGLRSDTNVEVWDVSEKTKVCEFKHYGNRLVFFPNGQNILCSSGRDYCVWDISTGELVQRFCFEQFVTSFSVSPDCKYIASAMADGTIHIQKWERAILSSSMESNVISQLRYTKTRFSLRNRYLVLEGENSGKNYLQILKTATMNKVTAQAQIRDSMVVVVIEISPDDEYIAYVGARGLCIWNEKRGELFLDAIDWGITALAFSSISDRLISGDRGGTIMIWNTFTGQLVGRPYTIMTSRAIINALAFSTTGAQFLVAYATSEFEHLVEIRDSQSGEILKGPFTCDPVDPYTVAFSASEAHIVCISSWNGVILDAVTGQILQTLTSLELENFSLSSNRKYIVWNDRNRVRLWDIDRGTAVDKQWLNRPTVTVAFTNDSEQVITMDRTGEINIWNIYTGDKTISPIFHHYAGRLDVYAKLSSNGKHLALVHDGLVKVWSLETHQLMTRVYDHHFNSRDFGMSPIDHSEVGPRPFENVIDSQASKITDNQDGETTDYALMAWKKAFFSDSSKMIEKGWVLGPNGELLFWIPEKRRNGLWRPNVAYMAGGLITKLNFDKFVHGSRWAQCRKTI